MVRRLILAAILVSLLAGGLAFLAYPYGLPPWRCCPSVAAPGAVQFHCEDCHGGMLRAAP